MARTRRVLIGRVLGRFRRLGNSDRAATANGAAAVCTELFATQLSGDHNRK